MARTRGKRSKILIVCAELKEKQEEIFKSLSTDKLLSQAITAYAEELKSKDIEIWKHEGNILITEAGYILAVYPDDIKQIVFRQKDETIS